MNGFSYDIPLDCFESGEKRPEKTKSKKPKNRQNRTGATNGSTAAKESRKRGSDAEAHTTSSKKPKLDNTELSTGVKRALNQEVRNPSR
jgi:hypothetical protein